VILGLNFYETKLVTLFTQTVAPGLRPGPRHTGWPGFHEASHWSVGGARVRVGTPDDNGSIFGRVLRLVLSSH
jgi:hypothetical protein